MFAGREAVRIPSDGPALLPPQRVNTSSNSMGGGDTGERGRIYGVGGGGGLPLQIKHLVLFLNTEKEIRLQHDVETAL